MKVTSTLEKNASIRQSLVKVESKLLQWRLFAIIGGLAIPIAIVSTVWAYFQVGEANGRAEANLHIAEQLMMDKNANRLVEIMGDLEKVSTSAIGQLNTAGGVAKKINDSGDLDKIQATITSIHNGRDALIAAQGNLTKQSVENIQPVVKSLKDLTMELQIIIKNDQDALDKALAPLVKDQQKVGGDIKDLGKQYKQFLLSLKNIEEALTQLNNLISKPAADLQEQPLVQ